MEARKIFLGLKKRLALLQAGGVPSAPVLEGPSVEFQKKGLFRIYTPSEVALFEGTPAALRKHIVKVKLPWFILQRLPGQPHEAQEWLQVTTRDSRDGDDVRVGKFYSGGKWKPLSEYKGDREALGVFCKRIERAVKDVAHVELARFRGKSFTVLSVYPAVRTVRAALEFVRGFVMDKVLTREEAILRISPKDAAAVESRTIDADEADAIARGTPASPGVAVGRVAWSAAHALEQFAVGGDRSILVVRMTGPEDVGALRYCAGIVTETGGLTSHAAVVARGLGLPCIVSAKDMASHRGRDIPLSMDGSTGFVFDGLRALTDYAGVEFLDEALKWVEPDMQVYANVDDAEAAREALGTLGATGIGLCRTEHQFFGQERIDPFRRMLVADTDSLRKEALLRLLEFQRADFQALFEAAEGRPVVIRLLDAPLHEFWDEKVKLSGVSKAALKQYAEMLHESNPMLGHRGCRLGITAPDIYAMQVQAIAEAMNKVKDARVRIMIPLVASVREFATLRALVEDILEKVVGEEMLRMTPIGTMIETPRACLTADEIAHHADFLSFGTNDLTQMTWGFSRDDAEKWLPKYLEMRVLQDNPFATLDVRGVGRLVRLGVELARAVKPDIEIGVCGEHAADPKSISAFAYLGVNYISCSPSRLKMARLAAAQVSIRGKKICASD